jgi:hypothetical protein
MLKFRTKRICHSGKTIVLATFVTALAAVSLGQGSGLVAKRLGEGVISTPDHHEAPNEERGGELLFSRTQPGREGDRGADVYEIAVQALEVELFND